MLTMRFWAFYALLIARQTTAAPHQTRLLHKRAWSGWDKMETIFSFGDSWTETGFEVTGPQPDPSNPLGNPSIPPEKAFLEYSWPSYLATEYNSSLIYNYNFAVSGSTVDKTLIPHGSSDFVSQVSKDFIPNYGVSPASSNPSTSPSSRSKRAPQWDPSTTLFATLIGINDVEVSLEGDRSGSTKWDQIFASFAHSSDQLYQNGARNFLFLNIPPMHLAPNVPDSKQELATTIPDWNVRTERMARNLSASYEDVVVWLFDTYALFDIVIEEPGAYPQTESITNTTGICDVYLQNSERIPRPDYKDTKCAPYNAYMWRDGLHPTFVMYEAMAGQIAEGMKGVVG